MNLTTASPDSHSRLVCSGEDTLMKQLTFPHITAAVIIASLLCAAIKAQEQTAPQTAPQAGEQSVPKVEIGVQYSHLRYFDSSSDFFVYPNRFHNIGGRMTYNVTDHLAVEAEASYFPVETFIQSSYVVGGRPFQAQFGVKAGKRFRRVGLFAKARPGLITSGQTYRVKPGRRFIRFDGQEVLTGDSFIQRKTHFLLDVGVVAEVYASRRVFTRFDLGDTMIRYGRHNQFNFGASGRSNPIVKAPSRTEHNLQFSAGVGFRLGALGEDEDGTTAAHVPKPSAATRFEAGAHFTSLSLTPINELRIDLFFGPSPLTTTAPGFGGRFTYNVTDYLAVEAETNLLPQKLYLAVGASGRVTQGQFGIKAGRRFERLGIFGKVRPGFVSFDSSLKQIGTIPYTLAFNFAGIQSAIGVFETGRRTFFSTDVGGVLELYPTRRVLLRFDAGDTIIRYGERSINNIISLRNPISVAPPVTKHNLQLSTGVGFRF